MDDTDGSSSAAQGAHLQQNDKISEMAESSDKEGKAENPGLIGRLLKAFTPPDEPPTEVASGLSTKSHGMMNLRRMRVEDVAIPTAEIVAASSSISKEELVSLFRESGMTRIPIYEGTLDTPLGFVHLKDFALTHGFNGDTTEFDIRSMLRPCLFVPPSMPIGVLLAKMQTERRHMALVIDEYGGVDGLLTIEDLIEQVVGEIEDEHDTDEDRPWVMEKPGCYVALAKTPLSEFEDEIDLSLTDHDAVDEEEIDTLGGLVFMLSGRVPARGEVVPHPSGPEFEVMDADARRIKRLRVRLPESS